jgi:glyoxylase-like metal-dependent hydrolase (beta-lactamase superfamily II)
MNRAGDAADPGTISRRDALKTFGAASATLAAGAPALRAKAQDRPAAVDDLGYYRFEIGDINATVIHDGTFVFPSAVFATNAPAAEIDDFLAGYNLPTASLVLPNTNLLLDTGRERILIDTGLGPYAFPGNERTSGKLLATLDALGIDRDSISTVFLTHAHPDHIGALTDTEGTPTFRNARHLLHHSDWDFWTGAPPAADPFTSFMFQVAETHLTPLNDRIERFRGEIEVAPGIRTVEAPGHTPGHTALLIESRGERLLSMGDNAGHHKLSFERPDWTPGVDVDPLQAIATKERLLDLVATERIKVFGDHHPFPGLGYVARDAAARRWVWSPDG